MLPSLKAQSITRRTLLTDNTAKRQNWWIRKRQIQRLISSLRSHQTTNDKAWPLIETRFSFRRTIAKRFSSVLTFLPSLSVSHLIFWFQWIWLQILFILGFYDSLFNFSFLSIASKPSRHIYICCMQESDIIHIRLKEINSSVSVPDSTLSVSSVHHRSF